MCTHLIETNWPKHSYCRSCMGSEIRVLLLQADNGLVVVSPNPEVGRRTSACQRVYGTLIGPASSQQVILQAGAQRECAKHIP